jgi:hypothetical protein
MIMHEDVMIGMRLIWNCNEINLVPNNLKYIYEIINLNYQFLRINVLDNILQLNFILTILFHMNNLI